MKIRKDITGRKFGLLVAIKPVKQDKHGTHWLCKCDCGNYHTTTITYLITGDCKSCGCQKYKGFKKANYRHGMAQTRIYRIWQSMKTRCNNPNNKRYKDYGGRGIKICAEWNNFEDFYKWAMSNGYNDTLSIDRIDNNKDYTPQNCRWATNQEQQCNKRNNHNITYNGETKTLSEWAKEKNIKMQTLAARINTYHWSIEKALETPIKICD